MKRILYIGILASAPFLMGVDECSDASVASSNIDVAAEKFELTRRIQFYNAISDSVVLSVEGRCSVEFYPQAFEVICKTPEGEYLRHALGRSDNTFPFVEQLEAAKVSSNHYRVVFKPQALIPDIDLQGNVNGTELAPGNSTLLEPE